MTHSAGDRVEYVGPVVEAKGWRGTVKGPGERGPDRYMVEFDAYGENLDMCGNVLRSIDSEGADEMARKTTVTHPDGTVSTRNSANAIYTYAVEQREDMWATAKLHRQQAFGHRAEKVRFIAAVRAGRIAVRSDSKFFDVVYLLGEGGEEWWLGSHTEDAPLDRKGAVRAWLADSDSLASTFDREADKEEAGPQYTYSVVRWSQSHENALKGAREFEGRDLPTSTFRVVPAEAAE